MQNKLISIAIPLLVALAFTPLAQADDADKAACAELEEGDACTRGDGRDGVCVPDESDDVLTCEDDYADSDDDDDDDDARGCSVGSGASGGHALPALLGMLALGLRRRR